MDHFVVTPDVPDLRKTYAGLATFCMVVNISWTGELP